MRRPWAPNPRRPSRNSRAAVGQGVATRFTWAARGWKAAPLGLALLLAGCGGDRAFPPAGAGPVLFTHVARIRGFDPARSGDVASILAMAKVYEGLLQYDYTRRPYRVEPALAEALPDVSPDGLTYTFRLRADARFQDDPCFAATGGRGRAVTAADVVYSIQRVADARNSAPGFWVFRDRIAGLDEFRARSTEGAATDYTRPVAGLQALDERTLRIGLVRPYPQLLWVLAMQYAYVVPPEAVRYYGAGFAEHPVGTGPYRLVGWRRNYRMEYVRNPTWHGEPGLARPQIERIVQYVMDDPTTRWLAFLNGQLDLYSDIARDTWDTVMTPAGEFNPGLRRQGLVLDRLVGLDTYYLGFNMDDPVVGPNRALRQALSCAFQSDAWIRFHNGRVIRATGPIPPEVAGHEEKPFPYAYDPARARRLLAEAGYPGGVDPRTGRRLELTLELGRTDAETRESTELLVSFMEQVGVVLCPNYNNQPAFFRKIEQRQAQMFRLSWFADYPDAENFLQLFYSPNRSPGPNRVNYANPEFDRLYEQARELPDGPARTRLYAQMSDRIVADAPWIFLHHPVDYTLRHAGLENVRPSDFPYGVEKYYRQRKR